jgi:hypothetical protein
MRPFARSQRRFRHHCEVNVPGLHLRFHTEDFCEPVRSLALPLRSVSRPNRGDVNARNPFSAPLFNTPNSSPISTPLQAFFRKPSGSKRSTGSKPGSSSHQTSDCPLLPAASSCDSASDQCSKLAPSELDLSFVMDIASARGRVCRRPPVAVVLWLSHRGGLNRSPRVYRCLSPPDKAISSTSLIIKIIAA